MSERRPLGSLRARATLWVLAAMAAGAAGVWLWMASQAAWQAHLTRAWVAGIAIHDSLVRGTAAPEGVRITPLPPDDPANRLGRPPAAPAGLSPGARVTQVSFSAGVPGDIGALRGGRLQLHILSADLRYPVAQLLPEGGTGPAAGMANVARLLASYCSDPVVFARAGDGPWMRIVGSGIWDCAAQPRDLRLWAVLVVSVALTAILSLVLDTAAAFSSFAAALRDRRGFADADAFPLEGPDELRQTVTAVNETLAEERARLEKRALVLSGVSHDLGTPATRLRLRTALIEDSALRARLEADIDRMTGMIDSVLTYTRAELGLEPARELSLTALIEAVVADYQDMGQPVSLDLAPQTGIAAGRSVFAPGGAQGRLRVQEGRRVLVAARPMALQRALGNLIDNALKYGRRAVVSLTSTASHATICVQDAGNTLTEADLARLTEPFARGANAGMTPGVGLGLTIVATIAAQHGGGLEFERRDGGLIARLTIARR